MYTTEQINEAALATQGAFFTNHEPNEQLLALLKAASESKLGKTQAETAPFVILSAAAALASQVIEGTPEFPQELSDHLAETFHKSFAAGIAVGLELAKGVSVGEDTTVYETGAYSPLQSQDRETVAGTVILSIPAAGDTSPEHIRALVTEALTQAGATDIELGEIYGPFDSVETAMAFDETVTAGVPV